MGRAFSQCFVSEIDPAENVPGAVWLATMEIAGYTWTVVGDSQKVCERALRSHYTNAVKRGMIEGYARKVEKMDPLEYHGATYYEMTPGSVEWL